jgi:hypothetical protein
VTIASANPLAWTTATTNARMHHAVASSTAAHVIADFLKETRTNRDPQNSCKHWERCNTHSDSINNAKGVNEVLAGASEP